MPGLEMKIRMWFIFTKLHLLGYEQVPTEVELGLGLDNET